MARLHKTLADYLVIAVSPALIMSLVGSLVFFLVEIFYQGQYDERLRFVLAAFVMAAVLIGRIWIELGAERAGMYAVVLALATALAINKLVVQQGGALGSLGLLVNLGLIALIWWGAHKLVWDCTLINEAEDSSGEGLVQVTGLARLFRRRVKADPAQAGTPTPAPGEGGADIRRAVDQPAQAGTPTPAPGEGGADIWRAVDQPAKAGTPTPAPGEGGALTWREWLRGGQRRACPGRLDCLLLAGGIPLFGIGQAMAPSGNPDQRRSLFRLLVVYVASGLGLLLATSLLGLRRYLRQRRLQMPGPMAGLWVTIGVAMIVAILAFALLFPRPNPEYSLADLAPRWTSPPQQSSRYAVGRDGADQNRPDSPAVAKPQVDRPPSSVTAPKGKGAGAPGKDGEAQNQQGSDSRGKAEGQRGSDRQGKAQSRQGSDRQASDGREKSSGQEKAADSRNGPNQESPAEKGKEESESRRDDRRQEPDQQRNGEDSQKGSAEKANRPKDPGANRGSDRQTSSRSRNDNRSREAQSAKRENQDKSSENARSGSPSSAPPPSPPLPLSQAGSWFATLMKWISLAVLAFVVGWWLFRCWREVLAELRRILEELRTFWQGLFGGKRARRRVFPRRKLPAGPPCARLRRFPIRSSPAPPRKSGPKNWFATASRHWRHGAANTIVPATRNRRRTNSLNRSADRPIRSRERSRAGRPLLSRGIRLGYRRRRGDRIAAPFLAGLE